MSPRDPIFSEPTALFVPDRNSIDRFLLADIKPIMDLREEGCVLEFITPARAWVQASLNNSYHRTASHLPKSRYTILIWQFYSSYLWVFSRRMVDHTVDGSYRPHTGTRTQSSSGSGSLRTSTTDRSGVPGTKGVRLVLVGLVVSPPSNSPLVRWQ